MGAGGGGELRLVGALQLRSRSQLGFDLKGGCQRQPRVEGRLERTKNLGTISTQDRINT